MRKYAWLAVCGILWTTAFASAQQPLYPFSGGPSLYGNPGVNGFPGHAAPNSQAVPAMSVHTADGPKKDATEPYFVMPESLPNIMAPAKPEPKTPTTVREAVAQMFEPVGPSEPYTTYEGRRYVAEMRQDCTHLWTQVEFIHWWIRRVSTPTLASTGILGQPATVPLIGDDTIGPREFSGIRATVGWWRDPERLQSLEITGFWVGRHSRDYIASSDSPASPLVVQPLLTIAGEGGYVVGAPGLASGRMDVSTIVDFYGVELNLARNILRLEGWTFDTILGGRYIYLNDAMTMNQSITVLPGGAGTFPFLGVGQPAGANFAINDSFNVTNRFFGGQIGARVNWAWCRYDIGATVKVGFGAINHVAIIDGSTTLNVAGTSSTASGGTLAQATNIGRHTSTDFSVVPEFNATFGCQITPSLRLLVGYNLLYMSRVQRVGNLIDRQVDGAQVPTDPTFAPGAAVARPAFFGQRTDFWAQGINLGFELKF